MFATTERHFLLSILTIAFFVLTIFLLYNHAANEQLYQDIQVLDDDFIKDWDAADQRLIQHIRDHYLIPPADFSVPYKLVEPNLKDYSHQTQSVIVDNLVAHKTNGFFLECGAFDGETFSNTLFFEKERNWTGVLIEPDYASFNLLKSKNRKSWLVNGCLNGGNKPMKMAFYGANLMGSLDEHTSIFKQISLRFFTPMKHQEVWCFPLLSILLALNQTNIDFFSLDVENADIQVLNSLPWDKIDVEVLMVEYTYSYGIYLDKDLSMMNRKIIRDIVKQHLPQHKEVALLYLDIIFAKNFYNEF